MHCVQYAMRCFHHFASFTFLGKLLSTDALLFDTDWNQLSHLQPLEYCWSARLLHRLFRSFSFFFSSTIASQVFKIPLAGVGRDVRAGSGFSEYPLLHKSRDLGCDSGCSWSHPQCDTSIRCDRSLWEVCRAQEAPSKLGFTRVDILNLTKKHGQIAS